jgi:hypothetical protein
MKGDPSEPPCRRRLQTTEFKLGAGWHALLIAIRPSLPFGSGSAARFSPREPYESRGSRTVLEELRGETPWGYLTLLTTNWEDGGAFPLRMPQFANLELCEGPEDGILIRFPRSPESGQEK